MKKETMSFRDMSMALYDRYAVTIAMRERLCGGTPKNKELIRTWVEARTGFADEQTDAQTAEAVATMTEDVAEKSWIGFPTDEGGALFIWARQIKAMFRESMTMLRITTKQVGSKQILQHGFEIKAPGTGSDRIPLGKDQPDGTDESAIHVMTAQGPRTALRRMDYVLRARLSFEVWVLKTEAAEKRHIGKDDIVRMLAHAQENGLGASRSQGYGKFDVVEFGPI